MILNSHLISVVIPYNTFVRFFYTGGLATGVHVLSETCLGQEVETLGNVFYLVFWQMPRN